jgi:hypothetical protein
LSGLTLIPVLSVAAPAIAQERVPAATGSSERIAFQQQGFPAEAFRIFPTLRLSASYDDNVLIDTTARRGDAIITLAPEVRAVSQWARHSLIVDGFARVNRYLERDSLNNEEYGVGATGRLDVQRTFNITGSAGYDRLFELRGTPGDLAGVNRFIRYDATQVSIGANKQLNRVQLGAGGSLSTFRFASTLGGGNLVDQRFRNRDISGINGRVSYQYSAVTSVFVSGSANETQYLSRGATNLDRSSHGYSILGGVRFEVTRLLSGEASAGYLHQKFDDPRFAPFSGVNYNLALRYQPTLLTGFTLVADRRLTDSALQQAGGVLASRIAATAEHELQRNVLVSANLGYTRFNYRGLVRVDGRWTAGVGARYRLNRYLSAAASYAYLSQSLGVGGGLGGRDFDSNRFSISLIASR